MVNVSAHPCGPLTATLGSNILRKNGPVMARKQLHMQPEAPDYVPVALLACNGCNRVLIYKYPTKM